MKPPPRLRAHPPWLDFALLVATGLLALRPLALIWSADPNYAFGWTVPLLAASLFILRWPGRPAAAPPDVSRPGLIFILILWSVLFLPTRLILETVPDWRPALWILATLYTAATIAWAWLHGGRPWAAHFGFALGFLLLGVPWLFNLENPVIEGLMRANAQLVANTLLLADLPARAAGNTILLATGRLDVEPACSGIRSLQAALMLGLFLGEFHRFTAQRRALLVLLALLIALLGNYLRLLLLAARAAVAGLPAAATLHDSAALAILLFTLAALWLICFLWQRKSSPATNPIPSLLVLSSSFSYSKNSAATLWVAGLLLGGIFSELTTQSWFHFRAASPASTPTWTFRWPEHLPNFRPLPIPAASHDLLRDDRQQSGTWTDPQGWLSQAVWLHYPPRAVSRIAFDTHNPEICLPAAGLRETANYGEFRLALAGLSLPVHAYRFSSGSHDEYLFWLASLEKEEMNISTNTSISNRARIISGRTPAAFLSRIQLLLLHAWRGDRGSAAQTLEVSFTGPPDYPAARRAFLAFAQSALVENPSAPPPPRAP